MVAQAVYGFLNCSSSLQSLFVLKFVGVKNMNNGFAILLIFYGVAVLIIPILNEWMMAYFGLEIDHLYYIGGAVSLILTPVLMILGKVL